MFEHKPGCIRLIGLDLDGTTMNSEGVITPRVCAAIENAIKAGIQVLPATGRALGSITPQVLEIPGLRYAVTLNGAKVLDLEQDDVLYEDSFSREAASQLLAICEEHDIMLAMSIDGVGYFSELDFDGLSEMYSAESLAVFKKRQKDGTNLRQIMEESTRPVEKFSLIFTDMELREKAKKWFADTGVCSVTASFSFNLELNTTTANKGTALLALGHKLGIPKEEVMAMGDGTNDLEMLRRVGYGVAMGNAHNMLLDIADDVTATNDEDGVALAIEAVTPS